MGARPHTGGRGTRTALAVAGVSLLAWLPLKGRAAPPSAPTPDPRKDDVLAKRLCGDCHPPPPPDILPRASWRKEIVKMSLIHAGKGIPAWGEAPALEALSRDYQDVLAYYEAKAPAALPPSPPWPAPQPLRFVRHVIGFKDALTPEPAVANVRLGDLDRDGRPEVLACDMRQGLVLYANPAAPERGLAPLAMVPHPDHVTLLDLGGSRQDLLVADLGGFFPGDHEKGAAVWLRALPGGRYSPFTLPGLPRVADVEAADFDSDGRPDLLVAAFGWWRQGGIFLFLNRTTEGGQPSFERKAVDAHAGPIHVVPADLDADGKQDFVALIAQEREAVVAFLGDGKGSFRARVLYAAPHPNWGSSGLQLVDLDGDKDLDMIVTNGDMFDDDILKPYHGIRWLENRGGLRFEPHLLAALPGAHRAVAGDLDGDGDLDVVASAFTGVAGEAEAPLPALVWLEQVKRGRFERHTIARGRPRYPTLDVGDIDLDGDLDLVAGVFQLQGRSDEWLEVWENQRRPAARP